MDAEAHVAATLAAPKTDTERIVLRGVSWSVYEALLRDLADQHVYLTYSGGDLELMSPSRRHETWKTRLGRLVENLAEELAIPMAPCGSTTFKREDLAKGLEPDECYYVQHEAAVRGDNEVDLSVAPPPDLVIEVDITYRALGREPIYAALGVPELWRFDGERLEFLALAADRSYQPLPRSLAFPMLSLSDLQRFVQMFRDGDKDDTSILRAFREWVRGTLSRGQV